MRYNTDSRMKIKIIILSILIAVFVSVDAGFFAVSVRAADDAEDYEKSINKTEKQLKEETANYNNLQSANQIVSSQINTTASLINKTESEMSRKEKEIENLEQRIELNKKILESYVQEMYVSGQDPLLGLMAGEKSISDMSENFDQMLSVKEKVLLILEDINQAKDELGGAKEELAEKKENHQKLLAIKQVEKNEIVEDIVETKATIAELQKKLAELQSDLLALTGTSYSAKNIREAVEFASDKTGVPKGVLYGFLKAETNLGKNTGQCTYKDVEKVAVARYKSLLKKNKNWQASIDLLYKRQDLFYDIVKSLGYSKDKKVSCSPSGYVGQGGAMGVAQFMSDVWKGYESRITAKTGNGKPNPWSLTDGVMAMAIKLRGAGATSDSSSAIKKASVNYLGSFSSGYYNTIVYWSKNYKTLFE